MRGPIGLRISTKRKALRISQAALARSVGVSPSYLNLIEADKRQVGGALLQRIAVNLGVNLEELTGASEHRLIHELTEAFADPVLAGSKMGPNEARHLVATSPDIALIVARIYRAYIAAMNSIDAYADRLRADPLLSQLLHQVLSSITAIRSSAEILEVDSDLELQDQQRFIGTITKETRSLSAVAYNLIGQFDQTSSRSGYASARREVDEMIFNVQNYFPTLEDEASKIHNQILTRGRFNEVTIIGILEKEHGINVERSASTVKAGKSYGFDSASRTLWFRNTVPQSTRQFQMARLISEIQSNDVLNSTPELLTLTSSIAQQTAKRYLSTYMAGAILFPYQQFTADAKALRYDVDALSEKYTASFEQIAHRLVTLRRPNDSGVPFGFLRSDAAGRLAKHFPLPGLLLPNTGHACPLWAIYTAFLTPGQVVRQVARFTDGSRFLFVSKAVNKRSSGFTDPAPPHAIMLVSNILHADETVYADGLNLNDTRSDTLVGATCRLCTRDDCASREESPWTPGGETPSSTLV